MYCKYCGKELNDKKCDCEKSKNKDINFNNILNLAISVFKKPTSTVSNYVKKGDTNTNLIMLFVSMFLNSFFITFVSNKLISYIVNFNIGIVYINIFKIFIITFFIQLMALCILSLLTWGISSKLLSSQKVDIKKIFNLISISYVTIGGISAFLIFFNLLFNCIFYNYIVLSFSLILLLMGFMLFGLIYYSGLKKAVGLDYDKNCYLSIISLFGTIILLGFIMNLIKYPITDNHVDYNGHQNKISTYNEIWW